MLAAATYNHLPSIVVLATGALGIMGTLIKVGSQLGRVTTILSNMEARLSRLEGINDRKDAK